MRISDWSSDVCSSDLLGSAETQDRIYPDLGYAELFIAAHQLSEKRYLSHIKLSRAADNRTLAVIRAADVWHARHPPEQIALQIRPCRSEEHTSELQSLMRNSYAVLCLIQKNNKTAKKQQSIND